MENFIKRRSKIQEETSNLFASSSKDQLLFIEIPTGHGKTHTAILSAIKRRKQNHTAILISTNTNKNAMNIAESYRKEAEALGGNQSDIVVEIGKSNYMDLEALHRALELKAVAYKGVSVKALIEAYNPSGKAPDLKYDNNILIDDFLIRFGFLPSARSKFSAFTQEDTKDIGAKALRDIESHLENAKIIVTNHAYLTILFRHYGNIKLKIEDSSRALLFDAPLIIDEFHTIFDAAKNILSNRFSLFRLKYSMATLLRVGEDHIPATLQKKMKMVLAKISDTQMKITPELDERALRGTLADFKVDIGGARKIGTLITALKKLRFTDEASTKYLKFTTIELTELAIINMHRSIGARVELSQKGYPSIEVSNGVPTYKLREIIWKKQNATLLAMSGTLRNKNGDSFESFQWVIERSGLYSVDKSEYETQVKTTDLDDEVKDALLLQENILTEKIKKIHCRKYASLFSKSNYIYTVVQDEALKIPDSSTIHNVELHKQRKEKWQKEVGVFVANTMMSNALVLVVGYEDAQGIAKAIRDNRKEVKVHCAEEGVSMQQNVSAYQKDVEDGHLCCLVGTDQYYTGLNLPGDLLVELYIGKIPYKNPTGSVGKKVYKHLSFTKNESYANETLFKFLQGKGRPIRDYGDKAILYMLDERLLYKRNSIYKDFLSESATELKIENVLKNRAHFSTSSLDDSHYHDIYAFFYSVFLNSPIDEVIKILKIDNPVQINKICRKLLRNDVTVGPMKLDKMLETVASSQYTIYVFLLKITIAHKKKTSGYDAEKIIVENKLIGYKSVQSLAEKLFSGEKIDALNGLNLMN